MGEPQTHHLSDFGTFERDPGSKHQYHSSFKTPGHLDKIKKTFETFQKCYFINLENLELLSFDNCRKYGRWRMMKIRLNNLPTNESPISILGK